MDTPFKVSVDGAGIFDIKAGEARGLDVIGGREGVSHVLSNGRSYIAEIAEANYAGKEFDIKVNGNVYRVGIIDKYDQLVSRMGLSKVSAQKVNEIKAPMPGLVLEVSVGEGDVIRKGDKVLILEAMKMENVLKAPGDGVVKTIRVERGSAVVKGQLLIELE